MMTFHSEQLAFCPEQSEGLSFIEQLQNLCLIQCQKENRPFLTGTNDAAKIAMLLQPRCKVWSCKPCAAKNARIWIARIINGVNKMDTVNSWHMFTLTAHEKWRKSASVKNLRQGWKKLYNRIRYKFKTNYYVKVWEMHEDSTFHLHGLIDAVIPTKWLKDNARQCGMGYQVDIHPVENAGQVAGYICKYFLKSQENVSDERQFPRGLRRIEVSRNWLPLPKIEPLISFDWLFHREREAQLRLASHLHDNHNYTIVDTIDKV